MPSKISSGDPDFLEDADHLESEEEEEEMSPRKRSLRANSSVKKTEAAAAAHTKTQVKSLRTGEKRILMAENEFLSDQNPDIVSLRHPGTGHSASFMFNEDNTQIREIMTYKEDHRCWFIDDCIESNGHLYIACSIDPRLIVLPYLRSSERNVPLQQLLIDPQFPEINRLPSIKNMSQKLDKIADAKGSRDLNVWKFNEEKTMNFLSNKVSRLSQALKEKGVDVRGGATSGNYVKSLNQHVDDIKFVRYAFGMLSEYLETEISQKLEKFMKIPPEEKNSPPQPSASGSKKRESVDKLENSSKKSKKLAEPVEDYSKGVSKSTKKEVVLTAKQKALAKNSVGTKNIMSFFAKK